MSGPIVVGVDGSDASVAALEHAVASAADRTATVHAVAVVTPTGSPLSFTADDVAAIDEEVETLAESLGAVEDRAAVEIEPVVRRGEPVHEVLLDYAAEVDAEQLVLGRTGASALPRAVLGSTADRVARLADVPVVLVPSSGSSD